MPAHQTAREAHSPTLYGTEPVPSFHKTSLLMPPLPDCLRQWASEDPLEKYWRVYHFPIWVKNPLPGRLACLVACRLPWMVPSGEPFPLLAAPTIVAGAELRPMSRLDNVAAVRN
jgi:hypothetical protein